ncbi:hypothetical protein JW752_03745 [Candidatus Peregrinibacteria bacterium]|nr:hypothetical protein [Candidatus Peregrinibacteria bacterium]
MKKLGCCDTPVEWATEKADISNFRYRLFNLLLPLFLATVPMGCAAQKSAMTNPPATAKPAVTGNQHKGKKKPSGANVDIRKGKDEHEPALEKDDGKPDDKEWEDIRRWINKLRRDPKAYQKCYDNWECDQV